MRVTHDERQHPGLVGRPPDHSRAGHLTQTLDRAREHRSQFVFTRARGREVIFWQTPSTTKQARPGVALPTARASGRVLEIVVDAGQEVRTYDIVATRNGRRVAYSVGGASGAKPVLFLHQ